MREIKFRAWIKIFKHMRLLNGFVIDKGKTGELKAIITIYPTGGGFMALLEEEVELMQYTGLKDKNGKEIYEGDILGEVLDWVDDPIRKYYRDEYEVIWSNAKAGWIGYPKDEMNIGHGLSEDGCKTLEVIGNIYDKLDK